MDLIGILVALALLVFLAFRGWSVLLLAPATALVAAAFAGEPLLAHWTQTFMGSAGRFIAQFFPLFLMGALFGKLMEDSGAVTAIAARLSEKLGPQKAVLSVVLASAAVTYGGVSVFASMCPSAMMVPDLDERIRACRQGSGGLVAPIDHPPPPPAVGVPVAPKRCPSPSMGDCNEDTACRDARALFDIQNANTSNVCQRIRILQGEAEDLLRIYIALLILLAALFVALVILAFFAPSAVPAIVAVAAVVMLAAFITAAQRAGIERQIIALMDEARRLLATRSAAASLAERLCTCPGCGFPAAARATPAECIGIRGIEP